MAIPEFHAYLEGKFLQSDGQAGKRLISCTSASHDGEAGDGTVVIPGSNLDARNVGLLV